MKAKALTRAMGPDKSLCFQPGDVVDLDDRTFENLFMAGAVEPIDEPEQVQASQDETPPEESTSVAEEHEPEKPKPKRSRKSS